MFSHPPPPHLGRVSWPMLLSLCSENMTMIQLSMQASLILAQQKMLQSSMGHPHSTLLQRSAGRHSLSLATPQGCLWPPHPPLLSPRPRGLTVRAGEMWVLSVPESSRAWPERLGQEGRDICLCHPVPPCKPWHEGFAQKDFELCPRLPSRGT